jgi:DNA end-binding protein Ku
MLTDEELASAQPEKTRTIEISKFVALDEIDPILFDHPYYLLPAGDGDGPLRAYRLLAEVMADADKVAMGQFVLRTKEYLVAVRAKGDLLALTTMLFQREIRPTGELDLPTRKRPGKAKVDRAVALVEALAADFDQRLQVPLPQRAAQAHRPRRHPAHGPGASDGAEPRSAT